MFNRIVIHIFCSDKILILVYVCDTVTVGLKDVILLNYT